MTVTIPANRQLGRECHPYYIIEETTGGPVRVWKCSCPLTACPTLAQTLGEESQRRREYWPFLEKP